MALAGPRWGWIAPFSSRKWVISVMYMMALGTSGFGFEDTPSPQAGAACTSEADGSDCLIAPRSAGRPPRHRIYIVPPGSGHPTPGVRSNRRWWSPIGSLAAGTPDIGQQGVALSFGYGLPESARRLGEAWRMADVHLCLQSGKSRTNDSLGKRNSPGGDHGVAPGYRSDPSRCFNFEQQRSTCLP